VPAAMADYNNDYDKKTIIYKNFRSHCNTIVIQKPPLPSNPLYCVFALDIYNCFTYNLSQSQNCGDKTGKNARSIVN
jgi:hypothetical protein